MANLWLDDLRPAPEGWVWVKNIADAKVQLEFGNIEYASLDHDLGACEKCMAGLTPEQWLEKTGFTQMPHCSHVGTGYDLVNWMEEYDIWPKEKPSVHSRNPAGKARMEMVINKRFP